MLTRSVSEIRKLEKMAIESGIPEFTLMKRAGIGAARWLAAHYSRAARFVVMCGGGNNGGDALVTAAGLSKKFPVCVYSTRALADFRNCAAYAAAEFPPEIPFTVCADAGEIEICPGDVVVDGLLGIGFDGGCLRPEVMNIIRRINQSGVPVAALDLPSGVNGDTGAASPDGAVRAEVTLSFGCPKPGLFLGEGAKLRGALRMIDIGLEQKDFSASGMEIMTNCDAVKLWRAPAVDCHKNQRGRVLVWGSSPEYRGAAALTALGAMRAGAGMVRVASEAVWQLPNGAIVKKLAAGGTPGEWYECSDVLVCGCGWGSCASAANLTEALAFPGRLILDADALNVLSRHPEVWCPREDVLLTPHPGEAARLAAARNIDPACDRQILAQALADSFQAAILLKGRDTLIAVPGGKTIVVAAGSAALAVAGSGDVLAGIIGALAAKKHFTLAQAAALGAYIHGIAGENAPGVVIADDLPLEAGKVLRTVAANGIF